MGVSHFFGLSRARYGKPKAGRRFACHQMLPRKLALT